MNWIREKLASSPRARVLTASVLARPGTPSRRTWPSARRPMTSRLDHLRLADDDLPHLGEEGGDGEGAFPDLLGEGGRVGGGDAHRSSGRVKGTRGQTFHGKARCRSGASAAPVPWNEQRRCRDGRRPVGYPPPSDAPPPSPPRRRRAPRPRAPPSGPGRREDAEAEKAPAPARSGRRRRGLTTARRRRRPCRTCARRGPAWSSLPASTSSWRRSGATGQGLPDRRRDARSTPT